MLYSKSAVVSINTCTFGLLSFRDTPKSKLSKHLRESIESSQPSYIDAIIIDGNFYFYLLADLPVTFGGISRKILVKLCNLKAPRIDIIFDQIKTPTIQDYERDQRSKANDRSLNYQISGPLQTRPPKFKDALRNDQFKDSLIQFLVNSWEDDSFADMISYKLIYVTYREKCFCFSSSEGNVYKNEVVSLCSSHEEADSQIFYESGGTFFIGFIIEYLAKLNAIILIIYSSRPFNVVCELQEFALRGSD